MKSLSRIVVALSCLLSAVNGQAQNQQLKDHFDSLFPKTFFGGPDCKTLLKTSFKSDLEGVTNGKEWDALVLARGHGYLLTKADKIAESIAALGGAAGPGEDLYISLAVVSRSTGEVVYYCESKASGPYILDPDRLSGAIRKCLKRFFKAVNHGSH